MAEAVLNEWEIALRVKTEEFCTQCEKLLLCELRDTYVKAVYDSMNKGTGGGFEF